MIRTLLLVLACSLIAAPAVALELSSTAFDVSYHISHPAKEFDGALLPGGATARLSLDPSDFSKSTVDCDITVGQFNSDNSRRDSHMLQVMEALIFPKVSWKVTSIGLAGPLTPGTHSTQASGPLTIRDQTQDLKAPVTLQVGEDGAITVTSSFKVSLDAYGVERPSLLFVKIEDEVPIQVSVTFPANPGVFAPPPAPEPEVAPAEPATDAPAEGGATPAETE